MGGNLTSTLHKIKKATAITMASGLLLQANSVSSENSLAENTPKQTETIEKTIKTSKASNLKMFMNAFLKFDHKDRSLLMKTRSDLNTLQQNLDQKDFDLLLDKTRTVIKTLTGTEEQKVNTMRLLYRIASTKNGLDFLKKCDVNMPFRLESKIPLKSDDFSDFKDPNGDLKDGVITVTIGNMSPLPLTRYTMLAAAKLMEKKPVEKEEPKNKKINKNRTRRRFNYMERR